MKIATIVGARPQFIKAATVGRAIKNHPDKSLKEILIHTGQHYDENMSEIFFREMEIAKPNYHLGIGSGLHGEMTGRMLESIEKVLMKEKPDWVLIYGDTNSTLAGALAGAKLHIPVAHVEAGLRSFNRKMPEEINRLIADQCSSLLLTPNSEATQQLINEGFAKNKIYECGDVMFDAALYYQQKAYSHSNILKTLSLPSKGYVLATIHRAENTDDTRKLFEILEGFKKISAHTEIVWPMHPRTKTVLKNMNAWETANQSLRIIDPVGYLDMLNLETHAQAIFTDSGGVQKEAFFFKVPCFTLREETEWNELVKNGFNQLVELDAHSIFDAYYNSHQVDLNWDTPLFGDGTSAIKILDHLLKSSKHQ